MTALSPWALQGHPSQFPAIVHQHGGYLHSRSHQSAPGLQAQHSTTLGIGLRNTLAAPLVLRRENVSCAYVTWYSVHVTAGALGAEPAWGSAWTAMLREWLHHSQFKRTSPSSQLYSCSVSKTVLLVTKGAFSTQTRSRQTPAPWLPSTE